MTDPSQSRKSKTQAWIDRRVEKNRLKDPRQTRLGKLAAWFDRRVEKALDKAPIGSERLVSPSDSRYLYGPHGWEEVGFVQVQTSVGIRPSFRYRKVREADPAAVAELHQRLDPKP